MSEFFSHYPQVNYDITGAKPIKTKTVINIMERAKIKNILANAPQLKVKRIRLLTSVEVYNKTVKEFFMEVKSELEDLYKIKCEMK